MGSNESGNAEKLRYYLADEAVLLATNNLWAEAAEVNRTIIERFPTDIQAHNRLGKALTENGELQDAKNAFEKSLAISPNNSIALKNMARLTQLKAADSASHNVPKTSGEFFVEEPGKAVVTSIDLTSTHSHLATAPGHPVKLQPALEISNVGERLSVQDSRGEHLGLVEHRLGSKLINMIRMGHRFEAVATSCRENELKILIKQTHHNPAHPKTSLFMPQPSETRQKSISPRLSEYNTGNDLPQDHVPLSTKDWSDDDTEPGDDEAFNPIVHRVITHEDDID